MSKFKELREALSTEINRTAIQNGNNPFTASLAQRWNFDGLTGALSIQAAKYLQSFLAKSVAD